MHPKRIPAATAYIFLRKNSREIKYLINSAINAKTTNIRNDTWPKVYSAARINSFTQLLVIIKYIPRIVRIFTSVEGLKKIKYISKLNDIKGRIRNNAAKKSGRYFFNTQTYAKRKQTS